MWLNGICVAPKILMNFKLPAINYRKKWLWAATGYVVFCLVYTLTGNLHLRMPTRLTPSSIDNFIPFTDWTIWIYHSQFVFLLLSIYAIRQSENLRDTFYSMALACLLSFAVFIFYPTTIPRVEQTGDGLTEKAFQVLYSIDSAANCFPSLHVSLACLSAIGIFYEKKSLSTFAIIWACLIALSTMATKQHYFIDVAGGLAVAMISRVVIGKFT
jgi:membrane-associated phospholipid phosphatase